MSLFNPISKDWGENKNWFDRFGMWLLFIYMLCFIFVLFFYVMDWLNRTSNFNRILFVVIVAMMGLFTEDMKLLMSWLYGPETGLRYNLLMFLSGIGIVIWFGWINVKAFKFFSKYCREEMGKKKRMA